MGARPGADISARSVAEKYVISLHALCVTDDDDDDDNSSGDFYGVVVAATVAASPDHLVPLLRDPI